MNLDNIKLGQPQVVTPRQGLLEEAIKITSRDRNSAYGNPEDNFQNIANLWNAYFQPLSKGIPHISSMDVANLMILMKVARLSTNPTHHDSAVDVAGYAACLADCQEKHRVNKAAVPVVNLQDARIPTPPSGFGAGYGADPRDQRS